MSVLAITLARKGSKRIPNKNMAMVAGKHLLGWTIEEVMKSTEISRYIVSSDSPETLRYAAAMGARTHVRSDYHSSDTARSSDALVAALEEGYDYIAEIMCTNPLKTVDDIDSCIRLCKESGANTCASVTPIQDHHPCRVKFIRNGVLRDFIPEALESRRQDLKPEAYIRNGSIYVMKTEFLLENLTRTESNATVPYVMPPERSVNIDEPIDLLLAETILHERILR